MVQELITIDELSKRAKLPVPTLNTLRLRKKIPYVRLGYRTHRFVFEKVMVALEKLEIKAVA